MPILRFPFSMRSVHALRARKAHLTCALVGEDFVEPGRKKVYFAHFRSSDVPAGAEKF